MQICGQLELISFDADQTLFDFEKTMQEALCAVAEYFNKNTNLKTSTKDLRETRDNIAKKYSDKAIDMLDLRRLSFQETVKTHKHSRRLVDSSMAIFQEIRFKKVYFYPGVKETLSTLSKQYKIGLITNGNSSPEHANIGHYFDHIVLGEKYAFKKPDARLFEILFDKAGVRNPANVLHVGDSLEYDVRGANMAGTRSVWFNPDKLANNTSIKPHHSISTMPELLTLLT